MNHFAYIDGVLNAEQADLSELARKVGTPFYAIPARRSGTISACSRIRFRAAR